MGYKLTKFLEELGEDDDRTRKTKRVSLESFHTDPVLPDPVLPDPILPDPVNAEPVHTDPVHIESVRAEPVNTDPVLKTRETVIAEFGEPTSETNNSEHFYAYSYPEDIFLCGGGRNNFDKRMEWKLGENRYRVVYIQNGQVIEIFD